LKKRKAASSHFDFECCFNYTQKSTPPCDQLYSF
jgi:hypothetical protein